MKKWWLKFRNNLPLLVIFLLAFSLRVVNLGYSDYQGDEIKAFFIPDSGQTTVQFLLDQRKGPGQFLVTYLISKINPDYSNQFLFRIPFALAGVFSVFFFYKLLQRHFNKKIAFYASFFFATNGFFVALSRIVQYQAFVIFFMVLALYMFTLALQEDRYKRKGIFWGFIFWAFSLLFHYDGVMIAPFVFYLLVNWFKNNVKKFSLKDESVAFLLKVFLLFVALLSLFYFPFILNISTGTLQYWSGRISGDVSAKISSSRYLFTVYQPIYVVHFYTLLFVLGTLFYAYHLGKLIFKKARIVKFLNKIIPEYQYSRLAMFFVFAWFLLPFVFLEGFVYIPGTHIYTYLLPMTVILALGIVFVEEFIKKFRRFFIPEVINSVGLLLLFSFIYLQSYAVFVDNTQEYPWESEKFLIWEFPKPTPIYHLSMFGFPYYRDWEEIGKIIRTTNNNGYYSTNERKSIARFYVPFEKSTDKAGDYIYIVNPQSFTNKIDQEKAQYWADRYPPIFTFSRSGKDLVRVYYMEPGTLDEIIEKGY